MVKAHARIPAQQWDPTASPLLQLDGYRKPDLYQEREGGAWSVYLRTEGVRELFQTLSGFRDIEILEPLCPQPYGETDFVVRDLNGYTLVFAERL